METNQLSELERNEIVAYGIARGKTTLIWMSITLAIGWALGIFYQGVEFLVIFCFLRRYSGGYHADSPKKCYVISFLLVVCSLFSIRHLKISDINCFFIQTVCFLLLLFLSPVESKNRKLEVIEKIRYGRKTRVIAGVVYVLSCMFYWGGSYSYIIPIVVAYFLVTILLVVGCIKNCYESRQALALDCSEDYEL